MSEKTAGSGFISVRSLLNESLGSEDAGSTGGTSEYEPSNSQSCSNGFRESTANTQSTSEPRSTTQLSGPGQPMPTTTVGCVPSPGCSPLVNSSQSTDFHFPASDGPRQIPDTGRRTAPPTEPSYVCEAPGNTSLQSTSSQASIDVARDFTSTTNDAQLYSEALFRSPHAAISSQDAQGIQDPSAHLLGTQSYPRTTPSENASSLRQERLLNPSQGRHVVTFLGSDCPTLAPVTVEGPEERRKREGNAEAARRYREKKKRRLAGLSEDQVKKDRIAEASRRHREKMREPQAGPLKEQIKKDRNAKASKRHREKKKRLLAGLSEDVGQLRMVMKGMGERMGRMEKEQNWCWEFIRNLLQKMPWLGHLAQTPDFLSQTSNTVLRMNDLVASPQSYGRGGSWGEQPSKRLQANQVPEFSTPAYGGFVNQPTGIRSELPPEQDLQDISTRWDMSQSAG